ncbi:MAG: BrnT family toxin [Acidobacteria bacterium]|nr:BrnT family toxin [Acidobacteriota bacterium]
MAARLLFDWDEANIGHIARHGIAQEEAEEVIQAAEVVGESARLGESRTVVIGETASGRTLVVVFTTRLDRIRVVTAYPANRSQRARYRKRRR